MADDLDKVAIDVVAMGVLREQWSMHGGVDHRDYDHLTPEQFAAINARIESVINAVAPNKYEFIAAYERLTGETP